MDATPRAIDKASMLAPGFAERAGTVVGAGLAINTALVWALFAVLRARRRRKQD